MPKEIVDKLSTELQVAVADKEVQGKLAQLGFEVSPSKTPSEFTKYVADQLTHWTSLIRQANIKQD